ncbi:MAG: ABC transporter substrate-binding protein [Lachnospiraceae bacterium]|nr:ABC transporter substrate-binding protein [Lachnospiraceae bacterium]
MKKRLRKIVSIGLALGLTLGILTGCGGASGTGGTSDGGQSQDGGSGNAGTSADGSASAGSKTDLRLGMYKDLITFDPVNSSDLADMLIYKNIYARLFNTDMDMQPIPELVDTYEKVSDTEYKITFKAAKFSDGSDITAEDVAYCLERAHQSESFANLMKTVVSFEATGDREITVTTTGPSPALQLALSHTGTSILPKAYVEEALASGDWSKPITSGRYTVDSREEGISVTIKKNPDYFDPQDAAQNDSLTFVNIAEDSTRTIQVQTGEIDLSTNFSATDYALAQEDENVVLHEHAGVNIHYFGMDVTLAPFDNPQVRQAMCYAIDRDAVLQVVAEGLGDVAYTVLAPSVLGYTEANPSNYSYDPEKAKQLLADAGYADGFSTTIVAFSDTAETQATLVQGYLREVGITAEVERYDPSVRLDMMANHQCPTFTGSWGDMADAELVLPRLFVAGQTYNWSNYDDDEVNGYLQQARETEDTAARVEAYDKAVTKIVADAPWVPLYIPTNYCLARKDLQGVEIDGETVTNVYKLHY